MREAPEAGDDLPMAFGIVEEVAEQRLFVFGGASAGLTAAAAPDVGSPLALDTAGLARHVDAAVAQGLDQSVAGYFEKR